jgi:hypothetical protein
MMMFTLDTDFFTAEQVAPRLEMFKFAPAGW